MHQLQAFDPPRNHTTDRQLDRATALDRTVEHAAVGQFAFIVHAHHVGGFRLLAFGFFQHFVLQAGFGGDYSFTLAILFEEFLAGLDRLLVHGSHALFGTLLQERESLDQFVVFQALLFLADGIFDALGHGFRVQVIHTFLRQALAHVQADTVGGFLRWSFQADFLGLRIATRENQANQGDRRR
ncbi:hypothetical protein D3C86_1483950 [compost metagenome]